MWLVETTVKTLICSGVQVVLNLSTGMSSLTGLVIVEGHKDKGLIYPSAVVPLTNLCCEILASRYSEEFSETGFMWEVGVVSVEFMAIQ